MGKLRRIIDCVPIDDYSKADLALEKIDAFDWVVFTSSSMLRAFVKFFVQVPPNVKSYCLGIPTQNEAKKYNIEAEVLPASE